MSIIQIVFQKLKQKVTSTEVRNTSVDPHEYLLDSGVESFADCIRRRGIIPQNMRRKLKSLEA